MSAAFRCAVREFFSTTEREKLGALSSAAGHSGHATQHLRQISAWEAELAVLGNCVKQLLTLAASTGDWQILLEYSIPRRSKRPDVVLLAGDLILIVEFKIGATSFVGADEWQVLSYALDLRDFHAESVDRKIVPVLVATGIATDVASSSDQANDKSLVLPVERIGTTDGHSLAQRLYAIHSELHVAGASKIDVIAWEHSAYRPAPNIIEAAETLFAGHSVAEISHSFATNLQSTSNALFRAIERSQREKRRTICFVTGIPGAGKTLAGLNAVHDPAIRRNNRPPAVFLSGNGPLVKVVREALIRNRVADGMDRQSASHAVSAFISNVHGFLESYGIRNVQIPPHENAIVFDEAQRAWDAATVKKKHGIDKSEPQMILEIMQRAPDWCTVVALVGGGQEIHTGEAGLAEWGRALNSSTVPWRVLASSDAVRGGASVAAQKLFADCQAPHLEVIEIPELHLDVGVRSPRANWLGHWVNSLLASQDTSGAALSDLAINEFPIALTRNLADAKNWLREHVDGSQHCGLLASSGALRLRSHGIEITSAFRRGYSYADWFLATPDDCRSSNWLEVAATEFECQGLELDWTAICWGGDLIYSPTLRKLAARRFHGTKWLTVRNAIGYQYALNKYRVLLTRARRGMVIWVPQGDPSDPTRLPDEFDATARFLLECGLPLLGEDKATEVDPRSTPALLSPSSSTSEIG